MPVEWYQGKRVVVAGGGGSGMGAAATRLLRDLGAEVIVLDLREPTIDGVVFLHTDLGSAEAIDATVQIVGEPVHALLNCQGVSGAAPGVQGFDLMRVNFLGLRHLSEAIMSRMPAGGAVVSISSAGGLGWARKLEPIGELLEANDFEEGLSWCHEHEDLLLAPAFPKGYAFSKQALIVWTMHRAVTAVGSGIRVNCTSPGSTQTVMAGDFPGSGVAYMRRPIGRESTPVEQAWPVVFLASGAASYINGANLVVDGGHSAARTLGMLEATV
ncbi:MAG TPA: coniferyl-alcohol dehydrogenase [Solirubrobacteraceae bacterium]|nr:coniferyl-alcohol dehydrogenase [Solirubrobacteraceae bacterium]